MPFGKKISELNRMSSLGDSFKNRLARSRASVARGIKPVSNNILARMYGSPKPNLNVNAMSQRSNSSLNMSLSPLSTNTNTFSNMNGRESRQSNSSQGSNNSVLTWGSMNTSAWKAEKNKEEEERAAKQAKIAAFLARAKEGSPTGKVNTSWIKKTRKGGRKSTKRNRRCWTRRNKRT